MHSLCKESKIADALHLKRLMELCRLKVDVVSYNVLITGLCKEKCISDALDLYGEMKSKGLWPNVTTYITLTGAMYSTGRMQNGEELPEDIEERGLIPAFKQLENLERRMEDAIRRLNMIRKCRKEVPFRGVELLAVDPEPMCSAASDCNPTETRQCKGI
jgi:pentatricopeptide repeat protein